MRFLDDCRKDVGYAFGGRVRVRAWLTPAEEDPPCTRHVLHQTLRLITSQITTHQNKADVCLLELLAPR